MDTIGKYQLVRVIGEGGMGRVYEAIDPIIGRRVAIKTISLHVVADEETRARFFREAQAAGQLSHPNLITIHDIGEADGTPFIVMEFLEGMDLSREIRQKRLSYEAKIQIMIDVCEGLAFAHGHDIVHRDIKPANIFVTTTGHTKILDFGLARGALSELTQTGKILGTPNYMAPEQIRGEDVDHRADIFATGVVFYELLSGRKAFEGDSVATTLYKVLETQPPPIHLIDEQLPAALSNVIDRALAKDRLARFQTSREMLDALLQARGRSRALRTIAAADDAGAKRRRAASPAPPRRRVPSAVGWAVAGVIVAAVAGVALWTQRATRQPERATPPRRAAQVSTGRAPGPQSTPPGRDRRRAAGSSASAAPPAAPSPQMTGAAAKAPRREAAGGRTEAGRQPRIIVPVQPRRQRRAGGRNCASRRAAAGHGASDAVRPCRRRSRRRRRLHRRQWRARRRRRRRTPAAGAARRRRCAPRRVPWRRFKRPRAVSRRPRVARHRRAQADLARALGTSGGGAQERVRAFARHRGRFRRRRHHARPAAARR